MNRLLTRATMAFGMTGLVLCTGGCASLPDRDGFGDWPPGASPAEVGRRVAENFVSRDLRYQRNAEKASLGVIYPEACAWYGSLTVAQLTDDQALTGALADKFAPFFTEDGAKYINRKAHVDYRVIGIVPLQLYLQTRETRYLELGLSLADAQWAETTPDGITAEARYWIDDMYMIPAIQAQAFRATGNRIYLDRAAITMVAYLDRMQQPNGLFFHGLDSPFFWGRGNGWMAAGMAELLRSLPADHPQRGRILDGYRTMMKTLLSHQDAEGMWHQLIDQPESWAETSCTGMFTFAMITGVNGGWLVDPAYRSAARSGWMALVSRLDADANIPDVCAGTNKGFTTQYYLDRPRQVGDLHGQAPILWSASALLRGFEPAPGRWAGRVNNGG